MSQYQFEGFSSGPRYAQLAKTLLNEIHSKRYLVGDLLPTEFELCAQFGVSRFTVREAVKQLVQQGLVVRQPGVGSRVVAQAPSGQYTQTMSAITDLRQYASETTLQIAKTSVQGINAEQAALLGTAEGETWLHIQGLRYIQGQALPLCLTDVYVAPRFRSLTGVSGRMTQPLYQLLEKQFDCRIKAVQQELRAMLLPAALAKRLNATSRSAGLWIARRYMDERDELVELAVSVHPADRFSYREAFRREWHPIEKAA
jgi:DNA-binding GntR family transcriptional regulator